MRSKNLLMDVIVMYVTFFLNILLITQGSFANDTCLRTYYIFVYSIIDLVLYGHVDVTFEWRK